MRRAIIIMLCLLAGAVAHAQNYGALQGYCNLGGAHAKVQGLNATNYQQGIIPSCTITVYLTGTTTLATIYSDNFQTPLSNPFTANTSSSNSAGGWVFHLALNTGVDVVGSGGIAPNTYPAPVTLCTDCFASAQVTTPVSGPALSTNGVANADQTYLDLDNGSGVTVVNTSGGHVDFNVDASTLNPPQYQTAAANLTLSSATTSVTLPSVNKGSRLIAFADSNTYNCLSGTGSPYYPTLSDTQGNIWTVDAQNFSNYIGNNSGANMIVADTVLSASGSITVTATQPAAGGSCANAYLTVAEYANVVGVDVAGVQACSLGCTGSLAPSATAVAQNAEIAVVLSETASSGGAVATPGSLAFSTAGQNWAYVWQFGAANVGQASTSTITNFSQNFPGAAIILLKSNLTFQTGSTVNPGTGYALPAYGPSISNYLYETNITSDASGNNLLIPGYLAMTSTRTTVNGTTAGTAVWSEPQQGAALKQAIVYLNAYENTTATAQTITLPASFATVGYVVTDGGSCTGVLISGATVTLPSSMGATQTGLCEVKGY